MNHLRTFANDYLLPLVISALVLRALIPAGFMPGAGESFSLTAAMCNTSTGAPRTESIEIPGAGAPVDASLMHCDFCLVPVLGAAFSLPALQPTVATAFLVFPPRDDAPVSRFALDRTQIPRAPPLA